MALAALAFAPSVSSAQDSGVVYAGGSAGDGAGGFAGGLVALPGGSLGHGLAVRVGVNGGTYHYTTTTPIDARYIGAEAALVYQTSGDWGWASFSAGPRLTDTRLSPVDSVNKLRGTRLDAGLQTDGVLGNDWRLGWFGSYGIRNESYIAQARITRLVDAGSRTRLGVEASIQGDPSYTRGNFGLHVATGLGTKWEGSLTAGASEQAGRGPKPFVSLGVSRTF
jgi:hypothetical protein